MGIMPLLSQALYLCMPDMCAVTHGVDARRMLARKPRMLVAVALANRIVRVNWAMMATGEAYRGSKRAATQAAEIRVRMIAVGVGGVVGAPPNQAARAQAGNR